MAGQGSFIDDAGQRARWEGFQWTDANAQGGEGDHRALSAGGGRCRR